jgi:hypothetical protein
MNYNDALPCPHCGVPLTTIDVTGSAIQSGVCPGCSREYNDGKLDEIRIKQHDPRCILAEDALHAARRLGRPSEARWAFEQLRSHAIYDNGFVIFPVSKIREYATLHGMMLVPPEQEAWWQLSQ